MTIPSSAAQQLPRSHGFPRHHGGAVGCPTPRRVNGGSATFDPGMSICTDETICQFLKQAEQQHFLPYLIAQLLRLTKPSIAFTAPVSCSQCVHQPHNKAGGPTARSLPAYKLPLLLLHYALICFSTIPLKDKEFRPARPHQAVLRHLLLMSSRLSQAEAVAFAAADHGLSGAFHRFASHRQHYRCESSRPFEDQILSSRICKTAQLAIRIVWQAFTLACKMIKRASRSAVFTS